MYANATPNARYGRAGLSIYVGLNALLLLGLTIFLWVSAARSNHHGIQPSTSLGFRSQATLASLQGWYVAQRVGFHFAAIASSCVTVAAFVLMILVFVRRANRVWLVLIPAIAGLGIGLCVLLAGQRAEKAAVSVEAPKAGNAIGSGPWRTAEATPSRRSFEHTPSLLDVHGELHKHGRPGCVTED